MSWKVNNEFSRCFICCKDCKERTMTCHSTCEKYLEGRKALEKLKRNIANDKSIFTKRQLNEMERKQLWEKNKDFWKNFTMIKQKEL